MIDYPVIGELQERRAGATSLRRPVVQGGRRYSSLVWVPSLGDYVAYDCSLGKWQPFKKIAKAVTTNIKNLKKDVKKAADKISDAAATNAANLRKDIKKASENIAEFSDDVKADVKKAAEKISHAAAVNAKNLRQDIEKAGDKIAKATKTNLKNLKKDARAVSDAVHEWGEKTGINDVLDRALTKVADTYTGGLASGIKNSLKADREAAAAAKAAASTAPAPGAQAAQAGSGGSGLVIAGAAAIPVLMFIL